MNEAGLRDYLKQKHFPDIKPKADEYDQHDVTFSWEDKVGYRVQYHGELKCRPGFTHDTVLIEKMKYDYLKKVAAENGTRPAYINWLDLKGIWAWDLLKFPEPVWLWLPLPLTTEYGNTELVDKLGGYLLFADGKELK